MLLFWIYKMHVEETCCFVFLTSADVFCTNSHIFLSTCIYTQSWIGWWPLEEDIPKIQKVCRNSSIYRAKMPLFLIHTHGTLCCLLSLLKTFYFCLIAQNRDVTWSCRRRHEIKNFKNVSIISVFFPIKYPFPVI